MITKDQYHTKEMDRTKKSGAMTIDDVIAEYGVKDYDVRNRLKEGVFTRVPTTDRRVHMSRRSVERYFSQQNEEE